MDKTTTYKKNIMRALVIGLAGGTGSGKTTVTNKILESLDPQDVVVLEHDSYYKDLASFTGMKPDQINFDHPSSLETDLLIQHIKDIREGKGVERPIYNFTTHR
ncbi:MAG: zeta toxin family protein, partial [Bacteroidota bacterium]